jgi:hypothetical protein
MAKYVHVKAQPPAADASQAQTAKIMRLRALRLEKEAADREAAARAAAVAAAAALPRRTRALRPSPDRRKTAPTADREALISLPPERDAGIVRSSIPKLKVP